MKTRLLAALLLLAASAGSVRAQVHEAAQRPSTSRLSLAAGLGVSYIGAADIVDLANATPGALSRIPEFTSAVEFFGTGTVPLSAQWLLKLDYAYLLAGFSTEAAEYTLTAHLPSLVLQYVLAGEPLYNLKAGLGLGYHVGKLSRKSYLQDAVFTGAGPAMLLDLEGNTAIGDHLFAFLDVGLRWEWMGRLTDPQGRNPGGLLGGETTLHMFGPGAKIGMAFLF